MSATRRTSPAHVETLRAEFVRVRRATERIASPLSPEDQCLQSMPACSPVKWHRAHTTWFFETFLLAPAGVAAFDRRYAELFNSYYVSLGRRHERPKRGLLSRPSATEVGAYRLAIDAQVLALIDRADEHAIEQLAPILELGLAHEEQHQELMLTDILHAFSQSPLLPVYRPRDVERPTLDATAMRFVPCDGGLVEIGAPSDGAFHFDNEGPRHRIFLEPFALSNRLVSCGEWRAFVREGGYRTPSLWLSDGWDWLTANAITSPLYMHEDHATRMRFGLDGLHRADDADPIAHVSYYEADAIARFLGARLPTEAEWESVAAKLVASNGHFVESERLTPRPPTEATDAPSQLFGDAWEWTSSAYSPYPGYRTPPGAVGEYNGKFMINQLVLRGGSCLTPVRHIRPSYRNFWPPETQFQMTGIRLARAKE